MLSRMYSTKVSGTITTALTTVQMLRRCRLMQDSTVVCQVEFSPVGT